MSGGGGGGGDSAGGSGTTTSFGICDSSFSVIPSTTTHNQKLEASHY